MGGVIKRNGVLHQLGPDQKPVQLERHISGQFKLQVGREVVLLTPQQALQMAQGIFEGLGIRLVEGSAEDIYQRVDAPNA